MLNDFNLLHRRRHIVQLVLIFFAFSSCESRKAESIEEILRLSETEVEGGIHVQFSGEVTVVDELRGWVFMHDGGVGIRAQMNSSENLPSVGSRISLDAVTALNSSGKFVLGYTWELSRSAIEDVELVDFDSENTLPINTKISLQGVVRDISITADRRLVYVVETRRGPVSVHFLKHFQEHHVQIVDDEIRVVGVIASGQGSGAQVVYVQSSTEIEKTYDSPISTFDKPIYDFSEAADSDPIHRIRIRGTIRELSDSYFVLTTPQNFRIRINRIDEISLSIGEGVEATGFLHSGQGDSDLRYAQVLTEEHRDNLDTFLETVSEVRTLPRTIASLRFPVKMKAFVTYIDSTNFTLFIHDGSMGIFGLATPSELLKGVQAGDKIEIVGKTDPGEFAPVVTIDQLKIIGRDQYPEARALTETDLLSGSADGQWVTDEGIVGDLVESRVSKHFILKKFDGSEIGIHVPRDTDELALRNLRGKKIRVKGVGGSIFTSTGRFISVQIWPPNLEFVEVIEETSIEDSKRFSKRQDQILKFSPDPDIYEPVILEGNPVYQFPNGEFYLFSNGYYLVRPRTAERLDLGKSIEVIGVARPRLKVPIISHSRWQQGDALDQSSELPVYNLNSSDFCDSRLGRIVRAEGVIGDVSVVPGNRLILLNLPSGDVLQILQPGKTSRQVPLKTGSNISLTGICHSFLNSTEDDMLSIMSESFVVLRSSEDLQLIAGPSFWTVRRIAFILGLALSVFLFSLLWVALLRKRVSVQTQVISEKLREAEELKDAAMAADAAKSEFLANMSHEIRTPLTSVLGFSELLSVDGDKETQEIAELIKKGGERLMRTLTSVLEIAELQKNSRTSAFSQIDVSRLIKDLQMSLEIKALQKGVLLKSQCEKEGILLVTDRGAVERVLTNLMSNAITYSPSGARVTVSATLVDNWVLFKVKDEGIGISEEFQAQMFEPFTQESKGAARQYEGNGLGLSIAEKLVQLLGGHIEVKSAKGEGTEFRVFIPHLNSDSSKAPRLFQEDETSNI